MLTILLLPYWLSSYHLFQSLVVNQVMENWRSKHFKSGWTSLRWLLMFVIIGLQARLVNLITRLRGQAYAFFRPCAIEQRTNYSILVAELQKRFTLVHLPTEQSSLFHDKKQGLTETVDQYAQQLRCLFTKAYSSIQQGTKEAETFGQTVLVNQFVAGLLPAIKSKLGRN